MRETPEDLDWLQDLLDRSYAQAGEHLASIHTDAARLPAADLVARMTGMQVLVVATVTADGRPLTGPVDSYLYRGRLLFGTSPTAVRTMHLARNPAISATHVRGESLVVTVHGRARRVDEAELEAYDQLGRDHYGPQWDEWHDTDVPAWVIEPDRMFAADMSVHLQAG
jgi:hypothetical protein